MYGVYYLVEPTKIERFSALWINFARPTKVNDLKQMETGAARKTHQKCAGTMCSGSCFVFLFLDDTNYCRRSAVADGWGKRNLYHKIPSLLIGKPRYLATILFKSTVKFRSNLIQYHIKFH